MIVVNNNLDPETLKIPAYMRKKAIVSQARQKLILTALDRKDAGLKHNSKKPLAPSKTSVRKLARPAFSPVPRHFDPVAQISAAQSADLPKKFQCIGEITHYLDNIEVAIIMLSAQLKKGDLILMQGEDMIFLQEVSEMQVDRKPVNKAKKGSHIGIKSAYPARINGRIYKFSH